MSHGPRSGPSHPLPSLSVTVGRLGSMTDLDHALALKPDGDDWLAEVPQGWDQGRTTFGGLVAAYLVRAAQNADSRSIRNADVYFLEPVPPGPIRLSVDAVRAGKHLTQLEIGLTSGDKRAAMGRFLLGSAQSGSFDATPVPPAPEKALDDCIRMPVLEGITPKFLENFDLRVGEGEVPMSGSDRAVAGGFVRNLGPAQGPAALMTHMDAWPPPQLALLNRPAAASSVRWHVAFHADVDEADGQSWSWFRCEAQWRSGPLSTVTGMLVRDGRPVAFSEQTIAMYA